MSHSTATDLSAALEVLDALPVDHPLTHSARDNIRIWLTEPRYVRYAGEVGSTKGHFRYLLCAEAFHDTFLCA